MSVLKISETVFKALPKDIKDSQLIEAMSLINELVTNIPFPNSLNPTVNSTSNFFLFHKFSFFINFLFS